jgi:hypothetical protein
MSDNKKNLKKLSRTPILMNFVKKNDGCWSHDQWVELCSTLEGKGYKPIDLDQVGALLEVKKEAYLVKMDL